MKHKHYLQKLKVLIKKHQKPLKIAGLVVLVALSALAVIRLTSDSGSVSRTDPNSDTSDNEPEIVIVPSPLTGLSVEEKLANRPVTAFVIENSPDARPQSGLEQAGVVYESIAEGGITRFVAFYQEAQPEFIGPVRSLRPYFIDWVLAFDASIAHVGGSRMAINQANRLDVKSLDYAFNSQAYERVNFRFSPHNVYTDMQRIDKLNKQKGYGSSDFYSWPRKDDSPVNPAKARRITVNVSSSLYNSAYTYDPATNSYKRSMGGAAHRDRETKDRITPKVVIAIRVPNSVNFATNRQVYDLVGSGKATIFQDGRAIGATWKKSSRSAMMRFENANGDEIRLNKGQVWITAIDPGTAPGWKQ